jgi:hypothetical protein
MRIWKLTPTDTEGSIPQPIFLVGILTCCAGVESYGEEKDFESGRGSGSNKRGN